MGPNQQPNLQTNQVPPPPPAPPPANSTPSAPRFPKIFIIGIVVLLLIILGAGAFVLQSKNNKQQVAQVTPVPTKPITPTPTPDPTANWKMYTNTKYGISIKYPPTWIYREIPGSAGSTADDVYLELSSSGFPSPQTDARADITFTFTKNDPSANWQPKDFSNYQSAAYQLGNVSATKISGVNRVSLSPDMVILAPIGNNYVQILSNEPGNPPQIFDQILSTFKFTDQNQTTNQIITGISGKSVLGPTCPVQRIPPDPNCEDKPYPTTISIQQNGAEVKRVTTDSSGNFSVELNPGTYTLIGITNPNSRYPIAKPSTVTVLPGKVTQTTVSFDSGMR